ncbi:H-NS histone family protein [Delftia sp. HK171]|nr:H-NS family nucleoid-associated regulatory protein [Delftia sp. HK171]TQL81174.1 H-NS histone family protein [Delftia sp. HK171]
MKDISPPDHRQAGKISEPLQKLPYKALKSAEADKLTDSRRKLIHKKEGVKARSAPEDPELKYRDPRTGKTWSGRGRAPTWIRGQDRVPFLIATAVESSVPDH